MGRLTWTELGLEQLREFGVYLEVSSPKAAYEVLKGIYDKSQLLIEFPRAGWRHVDIANREVRVLLYGHYRIIYEIKDENCYIVGVVHSAMDLGDFDL